MTPIKKGTASRLGLRKPTGVHRYKDGSVTWLDEALPWIEEMLGVKTEPFQRHYADTWVRSEHGAGNEPYMGLP